MPVEQAALRIARGHVRAAARGLNRARRSGDHKGLHAFRVAIRRLRSLLRAYRPWLGRAAGKKPRRRLRKFTRATNAARDADVQLAWLATAAEALDLEDRPGLEWVRRRLRARRRGSRGSIGAQLSRDFTRAIERLESRFGKLEVAGNHPFRSAFVEVLGPAADRFRSRLAAIAGPDDFENIHETRIQVKRLRYLVEPLRNVTDEARAVDKRLRKLQKILGDLHDMQVIEADLESAVEKAAREKARRMHGLAVGGKAKGLAQARRRDEPLGLAALAGQARIRRDAHYEQFDQVWLADRAAALDRELRALGASLASGPAPGELRNDS